MGRPRKIYRDVCRVVTDLDQETWRRFREKCTQERVSARKILASLIRSYLDHPVYHLIYKDPLLFENVKDPRDYPSATRETIGWVDDVGSSDVRITWDRPVTRVKGEKAPAGPSGLTVPRGCLVELRRLTA